MNLISTLYQVEHVEESAQRGACLPVAFELVKKSEWVFDEKKEKWRWKSPQTKNELYHRMLAACAKNRVEFGYVLSDVWYSSSENIVRLAKRDRPGRKARPSATGYELLLAVRLREEGKDRQRGRRS